MAVLPDNLFADLPEIVARATAIRHDLHQHPELGYQEKYASGAVAKELTRLGIPFKKGLAGGTGILATIQGQAGGEGGAGACVALRADLDALPICETTGVRYASKTPGLMHACGHDGHTSMLLGTAAVLQAARGQIRGTVKLLFQPAEEGGCGADKMVGDGVLENPKVQAIFGLHGWPGLKVGMIATKPGPLLASVDGFTIKITGKGTHAAAPHEGIDPIVCGAAIVQALQSVVARETDPLDAAVLTVAQFHAGANFNVIPDTATLDGTTRALSPERRKAVIDALERIARGVAAAHQCGVEFAYYGATPATHNSREMADFVRETALDVLGKHGYVPAGRPAMWGEDFAFYLQQVPGCFFVLGLQPLDQDAYPMLHSATFDFNDTAIPYGIQMLSSLAVRFLAEHAEEPGEPQV